MSVDRLDRLDHLDAVRTVADAVLYEGYLLYPYRASSSKNRSRWQFGVLGPPGAATAGVGEEPGMAMECLVDADGGVGSVTAHLRFLQLQVRQAQRLDHAGQFVPVGSLAVRGGEVLTWDEAVEREVVLPQQPLLEPLDRVVEVPGGEDVELATDEGGGLVGRVVRRRWPLTARVRTQATEDDGFVRLSVFVDNEQRVASPGADGAPSGIDKDSAVRSSLIGAHLLLEASGARFVSLLDPPPRASAAAGRCRQHRCWPVLAGTSGSTDVVLGSPIILYDYPQVAAESHGALFDATEIDEILTLRVMTMTDEEKAQARATDPRAAAIVDRCDEMTAADLQQLHGILRDPHVATPASETSDTAGTSESVDTGGVPWWDPATDASVSPETDAVVINGTRVAKGSLVRVHPSRRADAQDLFVTDQVARVTAVLSDVDGLVHVALILVDDPAADLHEWYGRYLYFSPDELEPLPADTHTDQRAPAPHPEESRS